MELWLAFIFGLGFGYILQRVGALEYQNIVNALRLKDLTIPKFMLLTVAISSAGVFGLRSLDLLWLDLIAANPAANLAGGLIFGVGFALAGYCPGTSIGALAEGKRDALYTVLGGLAGVLIFTLLQNQVTPLLTSFDWGKVTLADYLPLPPLALAALYSLILGAAVFLVDAWETRRAAGYSRPAATTVKTDTGYSKRVLNH